MITEIATLTIDPARAAEFEAAVAHAASHFRDAAGCHGMLLTRVIENPALYHLIVRWDSVEQHMVTFRESLGFRAWREQAGPFFTAAPVVIHTGLVAAYFHD
ncbi:MAG: antibiotic biosynthesis monooxygenase family protein [Steroidobacteraceae bacterium]